jgi:hypothetical protein
MADGYQGKNESLLSNKMFWIISLAPIALSIFLSYKLYQTMDLKLCFELSCHEAFIKIFKLPIYIASSAIPISGIYATIFRSIQTKNQIDSTQQQIVISQRQNAFQNHFKHIEEFVNSINAKPGSKSIIELRTLHDFAFPQSRLGNINIGEDLMFMRNEIRSITKPYNIKLHYDLYVKIDNIISTLKYQLRNHEITVDHLPTIYSLFSECIIFSEGFGFMPTISNDKLHNYDFHTKNISKDYKKTNDLIESPTKEAIKEATYDNILSALIYLHSTRPNIVHQVYNQTVNFILSNLTYKELCTIEKRLDTYDFNSGQKTQQKINKAKCSIRQYLQEE